MRYLRPAGLPPLEKTYDVPAQSRSTIWVDQEAPELASTDVSAKLTGELASTLLKISRRLKTSPCNKGNYKRDPDIE